jgi:hypothetical protein
MGANDEHANDDAFHAHVQFVPATVDISPLVSLAEIDERHGPDCLWRFFMLSGVDAHRVV